MELRQLRYFLAIADLQSLSLAAAALHVAQPALSRQIQKLEHEIGKPLLRRHSRGVTLTPSGMLLLDSAKRLIQQIEEMKESVAGAESAIAGEISVGMTGPTMSLLASPLSDQCAVTYPGLTLRLVEGFGPLLSSWLLNGNIDLAILHSSKVTPAIAAVPLLIEDLYLCGKRSPNTEPAKFCTRQALESEPIILPHRPHGLWEVLDHHGIVIRQHVPADALVMMKSLAERGLGLLFGPLSSVHREVETGSLEAIPFRYPPIMRTVNLCYVTFRPLTLSKRLTLQIVADVAHKLVAEGGWPGGRAVN